MQNKFTFQNITPNHHLPFRLLVHDQGDAHIVLRHWHESYEISYAAQGPCENYYLDGQTFTEQPGEVVVVNPFQVHGLTLPENHNRIAMTIMLPPEIIRLAGFDPQKYQFQNRIFQDDPSAIGVKKLLNQLYKSCSRPTGDVQASEQIGLVYLILSELIRNFSHENKTIDVADKSKNLNYIETAISWIDQNYFKKIDVDTLAKIAQISPSYFAHLFKEYLNQTPMQYVETLRTIHAEQLLKNTNLSVEMIGEQVGFPNPKALTSNFKALYGTTPHQYRLNSQKSSI